MKFFIIFRHWAEVLGPCLFFWRVCWNCILRVHRNTLGKKCLPKQTLFHFFGTKIGFFSKPCQEKVRRGYQKWNLQVQRKTLRPFFLKIYSSNLFRTLTESLAGFSKENLGVFVKTGFSLSKETFGKNFFLCKIYNLIFFRKSSGKLSSDCREIFRRFWSCFLPLQGNLSKKKSWKIFATFVDIFFDHYR